MSLYSRDGQLINDSGWIKVTCELFDPYNPTTDTSIRYRKVGELVEITGILTPKQEILLSSTAESKLLFTLPKGYRPRTSIAQVCQASVFQKWTIQVETTGNVYFSRHNDNDKMSKCIPGNWLPFTVVFLTS